MARGLAAGAVPRRRAAPAGADRDAGRPPHRQAGPGPIRQGPGTPRPARARRRRPRGAASPPSHDPELALTLTAAAALTIGQLLHDNPERDDAETTDRLTEDLLRTFGLPADEAQEICRRPLPDTQS